MKVFGRDAALLRLQMLFAVSAATATFFLVPRGVSVGEINIQSDHMSFNVSKGTYQLDLIAHIPVFNPNYLQVQDPFSFPARCLRLSALLKTHSNRFRPAIKSNAIFLLIFQ